MQHAAPPQYSPDGRWWWDGQTWTRVTWPVPTEDGSAYIDRPRRLTPTLLWVGLLALLVLVVLAFGGSATTWLTQQGLRTGIQPALVPTAPAQPTPAPTSSPGDGSVDSYRQVVMADLERFQAAGLAVADRCERGALTGGTRRCRAALQSMDDTLQRFQSDLDATPVPACLQPADNELRTALTLYHQAIQQELQGIDEQDPGAIAQGASTLRDATSHAQSAGSLLQDSC